MDKSFKEFYESPVWDDTNKEMSDSPEVARDMARYKASKTNGKMFLSIDVSGYTLEAYISKKYYNVYAIKDGNISGFLDVLIVENQTDSPIAETIVVYNDHQRQGLALAMYKIVIEHAGKLFSSRSLTGEDRKGGSFDLWRKLATIYPYKYVFGLYPVKQLTPVKQFERKHMGESDQRFCVSKTPLHSLNELFTEASGVFTANITKLYSPSWKIEETLKDIQNNSLSQTHGPVKVSKIGNGKYFVIDGNHRVVEAIMKGMKTIDVIVDEHVPDITKTSGAYDNMLAQTVQIVSIVKPQ